MTSRTATALAVALAGLASGCGADDAAVPITATDGQELFELRALGGEPGCVTCHSRQPDVVLVGPPLADLEAASARAGIDDPARYVRTSIIDPAAHLVPGFEDAKPMPTGFAEILSPAQIDAIVDYLLEGSR